MWPSQLAWITLVVNCTTLQIWLNHTSRTSGSMTRQAVRSPQIFLLVFPTKTASCAKIRGDNTCLENDEVVVVFKGLHQMVRIECSVRIDSPRFSRSCSNCLVLFSMCSRIWDTSCSFSSPSSWLRMRPRWMEMRARFFWAPSSCLV